MRETKFRAWDTDKKEWWRELILVRAIDGKCMTEFESYEPPKECDFILSQYTGLKDKNGVEIYEGDRLVYRDNMSERNPGVKYDSYSIVCFGEYEYGEYENHESGYGYYLKDIASDTGTGFEEGGSGLSTYSAPLYEVSGNIYESPSLLDSNSKL